VHTNSLKAAVYGGLAARIAGIPVAWHIRDRVSPDYLPISAVRMVRWLAPRLTTVVIANSHSTLSAMEIPIGAGDVIPSPVVFDAVTRELSKLRAKAVRNGKLTVGMVGRIAPWKGQDVFIDAFARAFPDGPARAVIIGAPLFGEDDYADGLRRQAKRLGLNGRVQFSGFQEDVGSQLQGLNILVHASIVPEPFGQVVVEGMAAGLPVVASGAGGPAEVIENDVTGVLYEPGNSHELAACLRRLADDPSMRRRLGKAAAVRAGDFAPEVIAKQVFGVYRSILESRPTASLLDLS
jgi:glycosyltransferase involved in cell wall biosynthesis